MDSKTRELVINVLRATAAQLSASSKKLRVFDCDETLLVSQGSITVRKADGEVLAMDSAAFAHFRPAPGDKLDFGAFNHVRKPRKIKSTFEKFKAAVAAGDDVAILTARAQGAASAITKFLQSEGVSGVEVVCLGSSNPYDKANWIDQRVTERGYTDVEFYDDSHANANAVAEQGLKRHSNIKFQSVNVPHPAEGDFDGPASDSDFVSDDPTPALVDYKPKTGQPAPAPGKKSGHGGWWDQQTEHFQKVYCQEHPASKYCKGRS